MLQELFPRLLIDELQLLIYELRLLVPELRLVIPELLHFLPPAFQFFRFSFSLGLVCEGISFADVRFHILDLLVQCSESVVEGLAANATTTAQDSSRHFRAGPFNAVLARCTPLHEGCGNVDPRRLTCREPSAAVS